MKKNSFKRFLAVTLAAATALTFAPVSTLGLSGVIEAQAATPTDINGTSSSGTAIDAEGSYYAGNRMDYTKTTTYYVSVTGEANKTTEVDFSKLPSNVKVQVYDTTVYRDLKEDGSDTKWTDTTSATTKQYSLTVTGKLSGNYGIVKKVYTAGDEQNATSTTANIIFDITSSSVAADVKKLEWEKSANEKQDLLANKTIDLYWDGSDSVPGTVDVNATLDTATAAETIKFGSSDTTVVADTAITFDGAEGSTADKKLIVDPSAQGQTTIYIYPNAIAKTESAVDGKQTDKYAIGSFIVRVNPVTTTSIKTQNVVQGGDAKDFTVMMKTADASLTPNFVIYKSDDTTKTAISSSQFIVNGYSSSKEYQTVSVRVPATTPTGTYTVALKSGQVELATATFDVLPAGTTDSETGTSGKFTYGGVLNSIYAYKGASYDLAEHAALKYNNVNYSGSELEWYLVDASTDPKAGVARSDLKSINMPADAGTVESGKAGSLKVTVSDPAKFNTTIVNGGKGTKIVAEAVVNGVRTVVYVADSNFTATEVTENAVSKVIEVSANVQASGKKSDDTKKDVLDVKIANPTKDNIYLKASEVTYPVGSYSFDETDAHYTLHVVKASGDDNPFKGSYLTLNNGDNLPTGTYYETEYIPFKVGSDTNTLYLLKVNTTVSVNTGVQFRVKDAGSILASTYASDKTKIATDPTVYLNLSDLKTWKIKDHIEADVPDLSKVSFTFDSDSANADVDSNGVITAKSVGNAVIKIKASYNGLESSTTLMVRVNKNGFDTITVTGKDGENARVLDPRDYDNNSVSVVTSEKNLVTKQIPYVQIEITGNETTNVTETPVVASKNNAKLSYAFVKDYSSKGLVIDPSTGKITIDYTKCTDGTSSTPATAMGVYAVKVVSAETNSSAATTSYYYVVVDYPDQTISGLQDNYTVGACANLTDTHVNAVEMNAESKGTATSFVTVDKTTDDFNGVKYYADDNVNAFNNIGYSNAAGTVVPFASAGIIEKAKVAGQVEHVVAYNNTKYDTKAGYTAKLITVKSAAAVDNYVEKITNKETGEVLYDHSVNATDTARELKIDKATTVQVTLAHPVASVVSGSAVGLKIAAVDDNNHIYNETPYVTAVVNSKEVDVALYPNSKGTTVIQIGPSGHLTATDRTDIHHKFVNVAVTYTGENSATATKPAKVTGVKVSNKKGAKVTVSYKKVTTAPTMKYYVQKKIGKKTSGKSVGSTKATLSVKKGATVKVRVKAYYYDANGQKHVGAYSAWKTLKTDKK